MGVGGRRDRVDPDGEEIESRTVDDDAGYTGGGVGTRATALLDEFCILEN